MVEYNGKKTKEKLNHKRSSMMSRYAVGGFGVSDWETKIDIKFDELSMSSLCETISFMKET